MTRRAARRRRVPAARRGFILFFGSKSVVSADPSLGSAAHAKCPRCGRVGTLGGQRVRSWFTIFFVPVFPLGGGRRFTRCRSCGASFAQAPREMAGAAARADAGQVRRGITLYNGLRASPANSVTLNKLMTLYLLDGEPRQAIGAAADFPAALDASEQCMTTLGRAHLQAGDAAEAIRWFDAALARNPDADGAHFQRATACLARVPPDVDGAVASARAARRADDPGAADLLAEAEARARGE